MQLSKNLIWWEGGGRTFATISYTELHKRIKNSKLKKIVLDAWIGGQNSPCPLLNPTNIFWLIFKVVND